MLHVAAILDSQVDGTRLHAWAEYSNWNDMLAIMRKLFPHHKFVDDFPNMTRLSITADCSEALKLLRKWGGGQDRWRSLEELVVDASKPLPAWYD
jgi:hypothetical protein